MTDHAHVDIVTLLLFLAYRERPENETWGALFDVLEVAVFDDAACDRALVSAIEADDKPALDLVRKLRHMTPEQRERVKVEVERMLFEAEQLSRR